MEIGHEKYAREKTDGDAILSLSISGKARQCGVQSFIS